MDDKAVELVKEVVRAQGAVFIRELLRRKRQDGFPVKIGIGKEQVLENLISAIKKGWLTEKDIDNWLREVEGWGRHHLYPFKANQEIAELEMWENRDILDRALEELSIPIISEDLSLEFPKKLQLTGALHENEQFEIVWKKRSDDWKRAKPLDYKKEIEGDKHEFRAWRLQRGRTLVRFAMRPRVGQAVILNQVPLGKEHKDALHKAQTLVLRLFPKLIPLSISDAVKGLDEADLEGVDGTLGKEQGRIRAQDTRFRAGGASVQFSASEQLVTYNDVEVVRHVREAVPVDEFTGEYAKFHLELRSGTGLNRTVSMSMDGAKRRAYLYAQMTGNEVWAVLDLIFRAAS